MQTALPDGTIVEAKPLVEPIGQFTHWYLNRNGEPRYLMVREANGEAFELNKDVNLALSKTLVSNRYMVVVYVVTADPTSETGHRCDMDRISVNFPYDGFEKAKQLLAENLDSEFKQQQPLKIADFVKQENDERQTGPTIVEQQVQLDGPHQLPAAVGQVAQVASDIPQDAIPVKQVGQTQPLDLKQLEDSRNDALVNALEKMNKKAEQDGILDASGG